MPPHIQDAASRLNQAPMKFHIFTEGCYINEAAQAVFETYLGSHGWASTRTPEEADLVIHTTCAYIAEREEQSFKNHADLRRRLKPGARLVVSGCVPKINPERLARVFQGAIVDPRTFSGIEKLLESGSHLPTKALPGRGQHYVDGDTFVIITSTGCMYHCSFCVVRVASGPTRSRPVESVLEDVRSALRAGYHKIRLAGDDVGNYGQDAGGDFVTLLEAILAVDRSVQVEIWQLNPWHLIRMLPRLLPVAASGRLLALRSQAQSGSDRVLRLMKRPHKIADFKESILALRRARPDLPLLTQIIVGFPGETEEDFQESVRLLQELNFDRVAISPYSERPGGTVPPDLERIPPAVMAERADRLRKIFWLSSPDLFKALHSSAP